MQRFAPRPLTVLYCAVSTAALLSVTPEAQAGRNEWATAGKVLAGVVAADVLFNHIPSRPACEERRTVVYCPPPTTVVEHRYYQPPPPAVVYHPAPPPPRPSVWHDGHYEYVTQTVWVDTSYEVTEWVGPYRRADGAWVDGHNIRRTIPSGYWKNIQERTWVEGGYYSE